MSSASRVDVWDAQAAKAVPLDCGFRRGLTEKFELGRVLGEGGFGVVRVVRSRATGATFACKTIAKRLDLPNLPPAKQAQHLENIRREVAILRKLRGTLNVVYLEDAFEDDEDAHVVMELCTGGELFHRIGQRHYSESTVASFMRAVLRTLAQCHAQRILHRDIKPGNFMLLTDADDAPLKAIDFGLAVFFDPKQLPRTDLGLEGTPWYMAPEALGSAVEPASDAWAAGVMAYQLLSGRFPFDDWSHPEAPALSLVWRSILTESPRFSGKSWEGISEEAKDFCKKLLVKDPRQRPSARDALQHKWLVGDVRQRTRGAQLPRVVQRLQRYNQQNAFKRTILDMMANELLRRHLERLEEEDRAAASEGGSDAGGGAAGGGSMRGGGAYAGGSLRGGAGDAGGSLRGGSGYGPGGSMRGGGGLPGGSLRGSMTALEALRRARERRHAEGAGPGGGLEAVREGSAPAAPAAQAAAPASPSPAPMSPQQSAAPPPATSPSLQPQRVVALDPWEVQFMAHRAAREGSAHGNQQAARLLRISSMTDAHPAARLEGTWHGPSSADDLRRQLRLRSSPALMAPAPRATAPAAIIGNETWHGGRSSAAALAEWSGADPSDAERFLAQARRQRQEHRKLARLVLEGSVHGGGGGGGGGGGSFTAPRAAPPLVGGAGGGGGGGEAGALLHKLRGAEERSGPAPMAVDSPTPAASAGRRGIRRSGSREEMEAAAAAAPEGTVPLAEVQLGGTVAAAPPPAEVALEVGRRGQGAYAALMAGALPAGAEQSESSRGRRGSGGGGAAASALAAAAAAVDVAVSGPQPMLVDARPAPADAPSCKLPPPLWGPSGGPSQVPHGGGMRKAASELAAAGIDPRRPMARVRSRVNFAETATVVVLPAEPAAPPSPVARPRSAPKHFGYKAPSDAEDGDEDGGDELDPEVAAAVKAAARAAMAAHMTMPPARRVVRQSWSGPPPGGEPRPAGGSGGSVRGGTVFEAPLREEGSTHGAHRIAPKAHGAAAGAIAAPIVPVKVSLPPKNNDLLPMPGGGASGRGQGAAAAALAAAAPSGGSMLPTPGSGRSFLPTPGGSGGGGMLPTPSSGGGGGMLPTPSTGISFLPTPSSGASSILPTPSAGGGGSILPTPGRSMLPLPSSSAAQAAPGPAAGMLPVPSSGRSLLPAPAQGSAAGGMLPTPAGHTSLLPVPSSSGGSSLLPTPSSGGGGLLPKPSGGGTSMLPTPSGGGSSFLPKPSSGTGSMLPTPSSSRPPAVASGSGGGSLLPTPSGGASLLPRPGGGAGSLLPTPSSGGGSLLPTPSSRGGGAAAATAPKASAPVAAPTPAPPLPPAAPVAPAAPAAAAASPAPAPSPAAPAAAGPSPPLSGRAGRAPSELAELRQVLLSLNFDTHQALTVDQLTERLQAMGYRLMPSEVADLARELGLGEGGLVGKSQFAASQLEWGQLQVNHRDEWLACLRATFEGLDRDGDGRLSAAEIMRALADKLPEEELNSAIEDVLLEAACEEDEGLDFAAFAALARAPSEDLDLDAFDARLARRSSLDEGSRRGAADGGGASARLQPVPEADG